MLIAEGRPIDEETLSTYMLMLAPTTGLKIDRTHWYGLSHDIQQKGQWLYDMGEGTIKVI